MKAYFCAHFALFQKRLKWFGKIPIKKIASIPESITIYSSHIKIADRSSPNEFPLFTISHVARTRICVCVCIVGLHFYFAL